LISLDGPVYAFTFSPVFIILKLQQTGHKVKNTPNSFAATHFKNLILQLLNGCIGARDKIKVQVRPIHQFHIDLRRWLIHLIPDYLCTYGSTRAIHTQANIQTTLAFCILTYHINVRMFDEYLNDINVAKQTGMMKTCIILDNKN
jgi:hypothetical protein